MRGRRWRYGMALLALAVMGPASAGAATASPAAAVPLARRVLPPRRRGGRVRFVRYRANTVYTLRGRVGYEIDLQFARGERFEGLGVGDARGVTVAAAGDHLFIKPRAVHVATDLTVLTNRHTYLFAYRVRPPSHAHAHPHPALYAVRFEYPRAHRKRRVTVRNRRRIARAFAAAEHPAARNEDYWYCGARSIEPSAAWDDGIETHLVFAPATQLPAVFVLHANGSESLVDFNMQGDQMVIDQVAHRFVLKRGRLRGHIVNRGFPDFQRRLDSETISPRVWRITRRPGAAGRRAERP